MVSLRIPVVLLAAALASGCVDSVEADHGHCVMEALRARLQSPVKEVDFVDACMAASGYQASTEFSNPLCASSMGIRLSSCYRSPSVMDWAKAKLR